MIYPGSQYFCWYQIFIFPQKFQHIFAYIFSPLAWQYHSSQKQNTQVHKIQDTYLTLWYHITFCSETIGAFCWCPLFFPKSISKYHVEFIQILNTEQFTPLLTLKHYSKLDIQNHHHEHYHKIKKSGQKWENVQQTNFVPLLIPNCDYNNFISFAIYKVLNTWWSQGPGSITLHLVLKEEYVSSSDGLSYDWGLSDLGYMQLSKIIVMKLRHWISRSQLEFRFILLSFVCLSLSLVFSPKQFCYLMHYKATIFIGLPEYVHVVFLFLFL